MTSWLGQSWRRGLLTTAYPAEPASAEEVPESARPPRPGSGMVVPAEAVAGCPVGALGPSSIDDGTCIRCSRCLAHGLRFSGPVEASTSSRPALVRSIPTATTGVEGNAPMSRFGRSLHVFMVDVGSCNACNLEVLSLANPFYDMTRLGIFFTNSPRHADVLLVVGVPTAEMVEPLRRAYEALPAPKAVLAVGVCPTSGGIFVGNSGLPGPLAQIVPVDVFVPGCPPTPLGVLDGLLRLVGRARAPEGG